MNGCTDMRLNRSLSRRESKRLPNSQLRSQLLADSLEKLNAVYGQFEGLAAGSVVAELVGLRVGRRTLRLGLGFRRFLDRSL